ncbi:MAG TPA: carboxymuconolactone decarboxylase family protein [Anaerolineaceae bacterium]|nr:carboxymuconolactone decarboxylase family protein [Anaerolineaceae bacterium]HPN54210.1 carboxymuconolactone decarboxylase family protein [Anaerolineaceae bacterium]
MFLPDHINQLYDQFSEKVYHPQFLDQKSTELIALACSVMADCVPCIEFHYQQAANAGAGQNEISEALAVAMSICAGSKRAKYKTLIASLEEKILGGVARSEEI